MGQKTYRNISGVPTCQNLQPTSKKGTFCSKWVLFVWSSFWRNDIYDKTKGSQHVDWLEQINLNCLTHEILMVRCQLRLWFTSLHVSFLLLNRFLSFNLSFRPCTVVPAVSSTFSLALPAQVFFLSPVSGLYCLLRPRTVKVYRTHRKAVKWDAMKREAVKGYSITSLQLGDDDLWQRFRCNGFASDKHTCRLRQQS